MISSWLFFVVVEGVAVNGNTGGNSLKERGQKAKKVS
jgi:hypothetical protein